MSILTSRRWAFEEMCRGFRRDFSRSIFSLLLAALALSIPLFIAVVLQGIAGPLKGLPSSVELTVFMKPGEAATSLESEIRAQPWVTEVSVIDRERAFKELSDRLGLPANKTTNATSNPLPDILIVTLAANANAENIASTAKIIEALPSVDFVPYEASWHEKLHAISKAIRTGLVCLGVVTALLVFLVIETAIRMTTLTARTEMRTLYLLGASPSFAIRPYAWRGFLLMGLAAATALGITRLGMQILQPSISSAASLYDGTLILTLPPSTICLGFVGVAAFVGSLIAALAALSVWRGVH